MRELIEPGYMSQKSAPTNRRLAVLTLTPKGGAGGEADRCAIRGFRQGLRRHRPEAEAHWKAVMRALATQVRPSTF